MLQFSIIDTGIGIPEEKQRLVFEAFEQADTSTTRRYGGTGLGLTISTKIVELLGGRIWLESSAGSGATFHFTAQFGLPALATAEPAEEEPWSELRDLRVLVVDDNATHRSILSEILDSWRVTSVAVAGADEGLAMLHVAATEGKPFQLILVDATMPGRDGFWLAEQMATDKTLQAATVMMLTALRRPEDADRCRRLGVQAYLAKPIKPSELLDAMMAAMGPLVDMEGLATEATEPDEPQRALRVLLAEDSPVNQRVATAMLEKWGHSVAIACNGRQAIAMFPKEPFDLVLMDVQMPEMDGLEATRAIRQYEQSNGGHVAIVALTAHAMKGDRQRCLSAGMDAYVTKPIRSKELVRVISEVTTESKIIPADEKSVNDGSQTAIDGSGVEVENSHESNHGDDRPIDLQQALEALDENRELLGELIEIFREECPKLRAEIAKSLAAGDFVVLRRAAHTLKGSLSHLAAGRARRIAEQMEEQARQQHLQAAGELWPGLQMELDRLDPLLDEFVAVSG
jgi:CheY-like chemotaxis protein